MKAKKVVISALGGPEVVKVVDYEVGEPCENEVRIKVEYAGLAYADKLVRELKVPGLPKTPFTPGADLTGIVDKTGSHVRAFQPGDRVAVLLMSDFGGQAQYVCVDEKRVQKVPDDVPLEKAVCLLINYLTAYQMLFTKTDVTKKDNALILVHGGSGGVGSALIQLAVSRGIKVIATASKHNLDVVEKLGAKGIDYKNKDFAAYIKKNYPGKVDAVFDPVGGDYLKRSLRILKKGGYYVGYGFQNDLKDGSWGIIKNLSRFMAAKVTTWNKNLASFQLRDKNPGEYMQILTTLFDMFTRNKINPLISEIIPIADAFTAHKKLDEGNRKGKILIKAAG